MWRFFKSFLLKSIPPMIIIGLAMLVGWWFYPEPLPIQVWATINEIHAVWDHTDETMNISLKVDKRAECRRIIVSKQLRPIVGNDVIGTNPIPLNGKLDRLMLKAPLGQSTLFDKARPRKHVRTGQYLLTVTAICEQDDRSAKKSVMSTVPVDAILVVQDTPFSGTVGYLESRT